MTALHTIIMFCGRGGQRGGQVTDKGQESRYSVKECILRIKIGRGNNTKQRLHLVIKGMIIL